MSHYKTINALGTPIVVHSGITKMLGSMTASALLSHIMYWSERTDNPLGFYRELGELKDETSLSDNELRTARKLLVKLGLIVETHKRLEHRLYFKFNAERFDELFGELLNSQSATCEIHNPPPVKSTTGELLNPPFGSSENHNSLYTKITTKSTAKITAESGAKRGGKNSHAVAGQNLANPPTPLSQTKSDWGNVSATATTDTDPLANPLAHQPPPLGNLPPSDPHPSDPIPSDLPPVAGQPTTSTPSQSPSQPKSAKFAKPTKPKFDPKAYPIGDCVDVELWCDFVEMRQAMKKPLTEVACKHLVKDFNAWADEGLSPNLAISHSIKNGYQGVFKERASFGVAHSHNHSHSHHSQAINHQTQRQSGGYQSGGYHQPQAHDFTQYLNLDNGVEPNRFDSSPFDNNPFDNSPTIIDGEYQ